MSTSSGTRVDAEPVEAAVDRAPGRGRRRRRRPQPRAGAQHQRVALADVAGDQHPAARRPARASAAATTATTSEQQAAGRARWPRRRSSDRPSDREHAATSDRQHGQRPGRRSPSRPRRRAGAAPRSATSDDPGDAPARERAERAGPTGSQTRPDQPAGQPEHRRRPDRGRDDQVGGDRDQADLAGDRRPQRRARQLGRHRHRDRLGHPARQPARPARRARPGASSRMPAVASTESAKPDRARPARDRRSSSATTADAERRGRRAAGRRRPCPSSATVPIAAARTTLGSVRASSTKPTMPSRADDVEPAAPDAAPAGQRPAGSPTTRVRLVPETASRWVRPVVRKSSASSGVEPRVVAVDQRRHQRPLAGRPVGDRRRGARPGRASAARHHDVRRRPTTSGGPRGARPRRPGRRRRTGASRPVEPDPLPERDAAPSRRRQHQHRRREPCVPAAGHRAHRRTEHHPVAEAALDPAAGREATVPVSGHQRRAARRPASRPGCARTVLGRSSAAAATAGSATAAARQRGAAPAPPPPTASTSGHQHGAAPPPARAGPDARPASPAAPAAPPSAGIRRSGAGSRRLGARSDRHVRRDLGQGRVADAVDLEQLVDRGEAAVLGRARRGSPARSPARRRAASRARPGRRC